MRYGPVFSIGCRHTYYADGTCRDFSVAASGDTSRILKNHRCLVRSQPDGILCSIALGDDGKPFLPVEAGGKLSFSLVLNNPQFSFRSDLSAIAAQPAPLFAPADQDVLKGGSLVLGSRPDKLAQGVFADIEIPTAVFANAGAQPVRYFIDFQARQARWLYYCVTDLKLAGKDLRVIDITNTGTAIVFSPANRTDLGQNPDPNDSLAAELADQFPDDSRIRFASDGLVACSESPRSLTLQLDTHNFPDILPAPALHNQAKWPFTNDQNVTKQDAVYQVVKYVSYSFSKNGV